jgi:hypothetical protein
MRDHSFFSRIREDNALERSAYFIQAAPQEDSLLSKMFRPEVLSEQAPPRVRDILIRRERQTFRKLPQSGAVLFAVKTAITPLQDLDQDERLNLAREIRSWPEGIAAYKGREFWGPCVLDFIECGIENWSRSAVNMLLSLLKSIPRHLTGGLLSRNMVAIVE